MRPPAPASSPAPADPPPGSAARPAAVAAGSCPFAVHRQPQRTVRGEVHAPVADNHYLFAAQIVPATVDERFHLPRCASHWTQCAPQDRTGPALFQRSTPGVGVDTLYFADPDVVVERRANKLVTQGSTAAPDRQPTSGSADPSGDRWSSIANRRGSARPVADDKIRSAGRHGGRRQRQRAGRRKLLPGDAVLCFLTRRSPGAGSPPASATPRERLQAGSGCRAALSRRAALRGQRQRVRLP